MKTFVLTDAHIKLLRAANVGWWNCDFGAPCIDPKRPYGNSGTTSIIRDIIRTVGLPDDVLVDENGDHHPVITAAMERLHAETKTALQIVLAAGSFEPGTYQADDSRANWRKVAM